MPIIDYADLYWIILLLNVVFGLYVLFAQRRNPAATWAWLMVVAFLPVAGFLIYMIMGQDLRKHHVFLKKMAEDSALLDDYHNMTKFKNVPVHGGLEGIVKLHKGIGSPLTDGNKIIIFNDGRTKFDALLEDIDAAEKFIFIQYYIFRGDDIGRHIIRRLAKKVLDGVDVYLIVDGMGCVFTPKETYKPFTDVGGNLGIFLPPVPVRMNFRNHRKLVVIDGAVGYIGGLNIGNEYLGMTKRFGYWRDTHMRVNGDAVSQLTLRFIMDWNFAGRETLPLNAKYFPKNIPSPHVLKGFKQTENVRMQIVSCGPDTNQPNVLNGFCKIMAEAKKSIYIQSPYFVPDECLFGTLRVAALSGVDVRIMFPANPDHFFVYWAALSYLGELIEAGVKCYEYKKGFIHSKTVTVDGAISTVGTANMDVRSFKLNFESTAFIYDKEVTAELEDAFMQDVADCHELTSEIYAARPRLTKIKESFSRLLAPLL